VLNAFGHDPWWLVLGKALAIFVFLMLNVLLAILLERKILGYMQRRPGPNRAGPWGALQSLADGIKLALKESITPVGVDKFVYFAAPVFSTMPEKRQLPNASSRMISSDHRSPTSSSDAAIGHARPGSSAIITVLIQQAWQE